MYASMWAFAAPGSGVSLNVGRTRVVGSFDEMVLLLMRRMEALLLAGRFPYECGNAPRPARNESLAKRAARATKLNATPADRELFEELDSLQSDHTEAAAWGVRREIVFLRHPECTDLARSDTGSPCH